MGITFNPFTGTLDFTGTGGGGGGGTPGGPTTSVQYNAGGGNFGGSANFEWDNTNHLALFTNGSGLSFAGGGAHPITMVGGSDTFADSAIIFASADGFIPIRFQDFAELAWPAAGMQFANATESVTVFMDDASFAVGQPLFVAQHDAQVNGNLSVFLNATVGEVISALSFDFNNVVTTNASALNEPTIGVGVLNIQIGAGYTQTIQPTPRAWGQDLSVQGPIALQPHALNGTVEVLNNYFNGTAIDSPIGGHWIVTGQTFGGHMDATHLAATTFANDIGLGITGTSTGGNTGWGVGIQVGGSGSPWGETSSKIGTGIHIRDYATAGLTIDNPNASTAPAISTTGFWEAFEMTAPVAGAANSYRLFAQDNGAGKTQLMVIFNTGAAQQIAVQA